MKQMGNEKKRKLGWKIKRCNPNKKQKRPTFYVAEEIIFEIFTRLSAKILFSCMRYMCHSWAAIVRDSGFIETHLSRVRPCLFVQKTKCPYRARLLDIKEDGKFEVTYLRQRFPGRVIGTCDGLVLLSEEYDIYVANPVTMQIIKLPPFPESAHLKCDKIVYGIARVSSTREVKVFGYKVDPKYHCTCYVLTLGVDNSWRGVWAPAFGDVDDLWSAMYNGGYLYWVAQEGVVITDVGNEDFFFAFLPRHARVPMGFVNVGNYLGVVTKPVLAGFPLFVLDPVAETWLSLWNLQGFVDIQSEKMIGIKYFHGMVNQIVIISHLVVQNKRNILEWFAYDLKTKKLRSLDHILYQDEEVWLHSSSLISWRALR